MSRRALTRSSFTILWMCAHPLELFAARDMLQEPSNAVPLPADDPNEYILGSIGRHHIVVTLVDPHNIDRDAEAVAKQAKQTFRHLRFCLVVGIGSGFPSPERDLHLGDVVVGFATVKHWDHGIIYSNSFDHETAGKRVEAPQPLVSAIDKLQRRYDDHRYGNGIALMVEALAAGPRTMLADGLQTALHVLSKDACGYRGALVRRSHCDPRRASLDLSYRREASVAVHYGLVASGSTAIRGPRARNAIRHLLGDILCVDTHAAGVMNVLPCLVIRGVCDYADGEQNDWWQEYAAATAAIYAQQLLGTLDPNSW
ncbi:hypothetical protein TWF696_003492 [Orbilia brochopaga]|uniref:Nucleoside phosphorylase domain-containing protein n=1 Tax=Orbilia brochopaga TaxID=3140254 RepID=A0AAV9TXJ5_9PEZI